MAARASTVAVSTDVQNQATDSANVSVTATILDATGNLVASDDSTATDVAAGATGNVGDRFRVSCAP